MAQAASYPAKAAPAGADQVLLLDSAASNAVKLARVDEIARQGTKGVSVPRSTGSAVFALDASWDASVAIANNGVLQPFGNASNFSGFFIVIDFATGYQAFFLVGGANPTLVAASGASVFTTAAGTAGRINVYANGSQAMEIQNLTGGIRAVGVIGFRTRASL